MELFTAIAMLCQVSIGNEYRSHKTTDYTQLVCQASYLECVDRKQVKNRKGLMVIEKEALKVCIIERLKKWS